MKEKQAKKPLIKMSYVEYKSLPTGKQFLYKLLQVLIYVPLFFARLGVGFGKGVKNFFIGLGKELKGTAMGLIKGSWRTKLSFIVMGAGNLGCGQIVRGLLFLAFETIFIWYMFISGVGIGWISKLDNLGDVGPSTEYNAVLDTYVTIPGDDSFKILLYGGLSLVICVFFLIVWRMSIRQSMENDALLAAGKKVPKFRDDFHDLVDKKFHKTLLTLPLIGILCNTVLPILFMIAVAFTNYDGAHNGSNNLFTWVGWTNFAEFLKGGAGSAGYAFGHILGWTLVWAFFATFTNYFFGMILAILINKKGIKLKKMWRSIFVMTIAVPQFISLLYMSKLFAKNGLVNGLLVNVLHWLPAPYDFWAGTASSRILVILVNIWVGVPYLMLMVTGILMNIPEDLYESSRIDGANPFQQFMKITLPYMLFITGPYLLTSFIGNINNFNVIFLLTGGATVNSDLTIKGVSATDVDLLITWLYKITTGAESQYYLSSVLGILIFVVISILSVIAYNAMPSNKNEEDFQ